MPADIRQKLTRAISRLFPKARDLEVNVDSSPDESNVYVNVSLRNGPDVYQISDLLRLPARIRVGDRYCRLSQKNRHTLAQLANLDPRFESLRGFIFPEKDVPEVLNYLRPKASVAFSKSSKSIHVDDKPLEFEHAVSFVKDNVEIKTTLVSSDASLRITDSNDANFIDGSKYIHSSKGYFKKPAVDKSTTASNSVGQTSLSGDQIPFFLLHDLKKIQAEPRSTVAPEIGRQKVINPQFLPQVSLQVDGPWIWVDVRYEADKFNIPFREMKNLPPSRQYIQQGDTWIQADKPTHMRVADRIKVIPDVENIEDRFRTHTYHFDEVQSLLQGVATLDISEEYAKFRRSLEGFSQIEEQALPHTLKGTLRDYQKHGYNWLAFLQKYGLNGILADEMGLGKTVQTIAKLVDTHSNGQNKTSLVVCPPSVLSAWQDDIKKFTSAVSFRTAQYLGGNRQRLLNDLDHYELVFTTYNIVTRDIELLSRIRWEYVVLDEAQKIKNPGTAAAKACKKLLAKHKIAVSGTPVENRLSELWSIYDFLMPSYLGTQSHFRDQFEIPIMRIGDKNAQEKLRKRVGPFKLRREKSLVATELPAKIPMDRYCELTPEQVQIYKHFAVKERERIQSLPGNIVKIDTSVLTAILRLKQICCHPALVTKDATEIYGRSGKLDAFIEIVEEILDNDEKALVFSQFTEMHSILRHVLDDKKIKYFYLDGSTPVNKRTELKDAYQRGEAPFFLISLQAGGVGMTLTQASCVVHYDRWWNPAVEDQATDRAHRIGQKNPVKVFKIHTKGTIDERIEELQAKKKDLFNSVIEVDQMRKEITKDDLLSLFTLRK